MSNTINVVKYESNENLLVWKHPMDKMYESTDIVVQEAQEAIVLVNGHLLDVYKTGRYCIHREEKRLFSLPTIYDCSIFFINTGEQMEIKWGTDSQIELLEPTYGFPMQIGASGQMSLRVFDSQLFMNHVVGYQKSLSTKELTTKFRALLNMKVKTYLAKIIKDEKLNIFEIDEHLQDISTVLQALLHPHFEEYGLALDNFYVMTIAKPDGDARYEQYKELHFRKYADIENAKIRQEVELIDSQTRAQKRVQEGYTIQQEKMWEVASKMVDKKVPSFVEAETIALVDKQYCCPNCGTVLQPQAKFCYECGMKQE